MEIIVFSIREAKGVVRLDLTHVGDQPVQKASLISITGKCANPVHSATGNLVL